MRKTALFFLSLLLFPVFLSGCSLLQEKAEIDHGVDANSRFSELIGFLDKDDSASAKTCFSVDEAQKQESFDTDLSQLVSYYDGVHETWIRTTVYTDTKEDGKKTRFYDSTWDLLTDKDVYRFATRWCVESGKGDTHLGIRSLSILRFYDDPNCRNLYWGDGLWTPGIHVAMANSKK
jgi:hypothetical protein